MDEEAVPVSPADVALVGFTSGSSGCPKPVLNSHEAVWRSAEVAVRLFGLDASDIFYTATDFSAMSAFRSLVTLPLLGGGRVVLPSTEARATPLVSAMECDAYGVTRLTVVPNVMRGILKGGQRSGDFSLSTLRTVFSGSGVLDQATAEAFHARFGAPVIDYYGAREVGTILYGEGDPPSTVGHGGGRPADVLIRILDDRRRPVERERIGEVFVLTDCVMLNPEPAQSGDGDGYAGWHATGDLGRLRTNGRVEIVGRKRDIIKTADGALVFPLEIETVLYRSAAVNEACAFSILDKAGVERVGAAVIRSASGERQDERHLETLLRQSVGESLGVHRIPARVLFLNHFPRVAQNKPDKARLRAMFEDAFPELRLASPEPTETR